MSAISKQSFLKQCLKKTGISQNNFAERFFCEKNETGNVDEEKQFVEKFKKHIQRESTSEELIDAYIDYFFTLKEASILDTIWPQNNTAYEFSTSFNNRMELISKKINMEIK